MDFETLLFLARRVTQVVRIPFTVDIEGGYSRSVNGITENIKKLYDAGVVGVNLEDTLPNPTRQFQAIPDFQKTLTTVANNLSKENIKMFINVRTDGFLLGMPNALTETLQRIKAYENSGASGIFVPCITSKDDIREVVKATRLPINVMCMPQLPDFEDLKSLGVKRISIGPFVKQYANQKTDEAIRAIKEKGNFASLFA